MVSGSEGGVLDGRWAAMAPADGSAPWEQLACNLLYYKGATQLRA